MSIQDMYPEVEKAVKPYLLAHARRISQRLSIPMDDALQEMRLALYKGLKNYDHNKSHGRIHRFADIVLRHSASTFVHSATTTTRLPHTVYTEDGEQKTVKHRRFVSLDQIDEESGRPSHQPRSSTPSPEGELQHAQLDERRGKLRMQLVNKLDERELAVFICLSAPTEAFLMYLRNVGVEDEPTHQDIATFLGVSKNTVDWATQKIRTKFTKLVEREFPDLVKHQVDSHVWPMIHTSRADKPDHEFVAGVIERNGLDPRPLISGTRDIEKSGEWAREIHNYPWGVVLILKRGSTYRTCVIEGRFNKVSGGVAGADGTWKYVTDEVPWYPRMVRELKS